LFVEKAHITFHEEQNATVYVFVDVRTDVIQEQFLIHILEKIDFVSLFRELLHQHFVGVILRQFE
jgi:hypothetical protein